MPHPTDSKPLQPASGSLGHIEVLEVAGRDAHAFLQAQTMNDVARLGDGAWQWNGCLSAKGRVLALFALVRRDAERYWLVLPDVEAAQLADQLRRFVFRSKVLLQPLAVAAAGRLGAAAVHEAHAAAGAAAVEHDGVLWLDMGAPGLPRQLALAPDDELAAGRPANDLQLDAAWRLQDLELGLPRLHASQQDQFTPQMLSLQRLNAFSLRKGCYPGQEIVARTHYLGQAKRSLLLLELHGSCQPGAAVTEADRPLGQVASVAGTSSHSLALAVCAAPGGAELSIVGTPARLRPIVDGLAR